jgi:hypothetical protein
MAETVLLNSRRIGPGAVLSALLLCGCAPDPKAITVECDQRAGSRIEQDVSDCVNEKVREHGIAGLTQKLHKIDK